MNPAYANSSFDVERLRRDFPCLQQEVRGKPLVYLDNAATTQIPRSVISAISAFHIHDRANIHRGVHTLSQRATKAYDAVRDTVAAFVHAAEAREVVFTKGTTEGLNLLAHTLGRSRLGPGDEVLVTGMEHHSNIVPWQLLCQQTGARLRVAPIDDRGTLELEEFRKLLTPRTKLAAISHVSNALGTVNPVAEMVRLARAAGVPVLIDGAQAVPHQAVNVQELDCDFYAFSSHKLFGPSGVGVLWGRSEHLEAMPPYQGGGEMISSVTFAKTEYAAPPYKFEAGTPNIAGAIGLGAAIDYVTLVGLDQISSHESAVLRYGMEQLAQIDGLRLIGSAQEKASVISFVLGDVHAHDVGTILDQEGVAVRTGHHCARPVMERFGIPSTVRASLGMYNGNDDIDLLVHSLSKVQEIFG